MATAIRFFVAELVICNEMALPSEMVYLLCKTFHMEG